MYVTAVLVRSELPVALRGWGRLLGSLHGRADCGAAHQSRGEEIVVEVLSEA